jgi:hypothetical protein
MIGKNKNYQYGHHMYDRTGIGNNDVLHISAGIVGIRMTVPVWALQKCLYWY